MQAGFVVVAPAPDAALAGSGAETGVLVMSSLIAAVFLATGLCAHSKSAPDDADDDPQLELTKLTVPALRRRPPSADNTVAVKKLIAQLAEVDRPDIGYSPTAGGLAFAPVPGHLQSLSWTWTNHGLGSSRPFRELVALGPDALPLLLAALGDKTPTKLTFKHSDSSELIQFGATWLSDELDAGNVLNPREVRALPKPGWKPKEGEHVEKYRVKIGDLCFAAIGQIVGRPYLAARYQMTSCTVINSPVEDAALRERVRKIWGSEDATRTLYESLWIDYRTTGVPRGPDLQGWQYGNHFQRNAALRLLYYFPAESTPVITARLRRLEVTNAIEGSKAYSRQSVANGGVHADEFVHAVAWSKIPTVRGILRRTTDTGIFLAALAAFDESDAPIIVKKAEELLAGLTPDELKLGACDCILEALAERTGESSAPTFRRLIEKADPDGLGSLATALSHAKGEWPVALLKPLLDDKRETKRLYYVPEKPVKGVNRPIPVPGQFNFDDGFRKVPVRVCDAAAESLSKLFPGKAGEFPSDHDRLVLDPYITRLKGKISSK